MFQGYPDYSDDVEPAFAEYYPDADVALVNPGKLESVANWPKQPLDIGQVAGLAVDGSGRPVVFHRADRVWESRYVPPKYFLHVRIVSPTSYLMISRVQENQFL